MATVLSAPDHMVSAMPSTKGEQTRAAIAEVALRMFREQALTRRLLRVADDVLH